MFSLADLVAPQSVEYFLSNVYGRTWSHSRGDATRLAELADWNTLNAILNNQRFESPRFRLSRNGRVVPDDQFTEEVERVDNVPYRRFVVDGFLAELRSGATLSIDHVDQVHEPIRRLASQLSSELRADTFVNLFASWKSVPGFDLHWDNQDVFALQLAGSKKWQLHEPTRSWPLYFDPVENVRPSGPPVVEVETNPGDVLYVPHGWWHSVTTKAHPSLHLSVGIEPNSGIDFLSWIMDQAKLEEVFRRRIPLEADRKTEHLKSIRSALIGLLESIDLAEKYDAYVNGVSRGAATFSLPDLFETSDILSDSSRHLALLAPRAVIASDGDSIILSAIGRRWELPSSMFPLLNALLSDSNITIAQAMRSSPGLLESEAHEVLLTLLRAGVIALR